jgi:hypothetical protein
MAIIIGCSHLLKAFIGRGGGRKIKSKTTPMGEILKARKFYV